MKRGHLLYGPPSLLLLLVVFNSVIGQNCPFEVQPCDSGTPSGDSTIADYGEIASCTFYVVKLRRNCHD